MLPLILSLLSHSMHTRFTQRRFSHKHKWRRSNSFLGLGASQAHEEPTKHENEPDSERWHVLSTLLHGTAKRWHPNWWQPLNSSSSNEEETKHFMDFDHSGFLRTRLKTTSVMTPSVLFRATVLVAAVVVLQQKPVLAAEAAAVSQGKARSSVSSWCSA